MENLKDLLRQKSELDDRIEATRKAEKEDAIKNVKEIIAMYDLTIDDLGLKTRKVPLSERPPKYIGPDGSPWSGIGRPPRWVSEIKAAGESLDRFLVSRLSNQPKMKN